MDGVNLPLTLVRIHIEEINQTVLMHMTEKMNYKHSEVLSAVLTNRACHTLAVYFLLNKKMKRLSKEYRVSLFSNTCIRTFVTLSTQTPKACFHLPKGCNYYYYYCITVSCQMDFY